MDARGYYQHDHLRDGSVVIVRAIRPEDKGHLEEAFAHLSSESRANRFFSSKGNLSEHELSFFTDLDFDQHVAIGIATLDEGNPHPIGIGRYIVDQEIPTSAEVAFTVDDLFQGIGVGSLLLNHLARIARSRGIAGFHATVLDSNKRMLRLLRRSDFQVDESPCPGVIEITIPL